MENGIILRDEELARYCTGRVPAAKTGRAAALLRQQKGTWEMLRTGYDSLKQVRVRTIRFDDIRIQLQFNPGRIVSAAANVDPQSIQERKCFLCPAHLPPEQRGLPLEEDYLLLGNPYPILPEHFTVPHREHVEQRISEAFRAFLGISRSLAPEYTTFYNGPTSGASAPDHLHFQAGTAGHMPLERELDVIKTNYARPLLESPRLQVWFVEDPLRRFVLLESPDEDALAGAFAAFYKAMQKLGKNGSTSQEEDAGGMHGEPMMNILATAGPEGWSIILFPRARHRPSFFFADERERILLSPGAVDMAGLCIAPRERDFDRIMPEDIAQMFDEVSMPVVPFDRLGTELEQALRI